jgi:hypothetical protein
MTSFTYTNGVFFTYNLFLLSEMHQHLLMFICYLFVSMGLLNRSMNYSCMILVRNFVMFLNDCGIMWILCEAPEGSFPSFDILNFEGWLQVFKTTLEKTVCNHSMIFFISWSDIQAKMETLTLWSLMQDPYVKYLLSWTKGWVLVKCT